MILEIIITVLSIFTCFISYLFVLSLKRIRQYENFIIQLQQIVEYATEKMKTVDASGHYESDDETGFFFEQLKELQVLFNEIFESEEEKGNIDVNQEKN
jgi:hypothetical protein